MAKANKHTRKITVDAVEYRWKISQSASEYTNAYYHGIQTYINFIVFTGSGNNQTLFCKVVEFPYFMVTPRFVKDCIEDALTLGWQPNEKGKNFHYEYIKPLPIYQNSMGFNFQDALIESAFFDDNSFILQTKLKKSNYDGYPWVVLVFSKIQHLDSVKLLFKEVTKNQTIALLKFDENFDSYVNDYYVFIKLDNGKFITIHSHQFERLLYSDDTLQDCKYL